MPFDPAYEVPLRRIAFEGLLGEGAFGLVFRGSANHMPGGIEGPLTVAVKTLRSSYLASFTLTVSNQFYDNLVCLS